MAILQSELLRYANQQISKASLENFSKRESAEIRAFLCHSHNDAELAKGFQNLFRDKGVDIYIDWQDSEMPPAPNEQTAKNIKKRIISARLFFFLATQNSIKSRWCPWEIGIAEGIAKKIFIIPTQDTAGNYHGNEYLQLYSRIDVGFDKANRSGYAIFNPDAVEGPWISTEVFK